MEKYFYKSETVSFLSWKREHDNLWEFIYQYGIIYIKISMREIGARFGTNHQRRIKKLLHRYNAYYQNPNNIILFKTCDDAERFFNEVYYPMYLKKELEK